MLPKTHIILSVLFVLIIFFLKIVNWWQGLIVFAAAVLIDVDHWLLYVKKKKDFSVKRAYKWFYQFYINKTRKVFLFIFHTIESFIVVIILSIFFPIFLYVLIGMSFHILLDFLQAYDEDFYGKRWSLIYSLIKD